MVEFHHLHQALLHGRCGLLVDTVLATRSEEVALLHLIGPDALGDTDHPQELVDVVTGVAKKTTEDNKDIVYLVLAHDRVGDFLLGAHSLTDGGNVRVVPGVVVDKGRTVSHTTNLVAVIPPGHDLGILGSVLPEPVVRLTVVVNDVLATIGQPGRKDNGGRRVGIGCNPCAVEHKEHEVHGGCTDNCELGGVRVDTDEGLASRAKAVGKDCCGSNLGSVCSVGLLRLGLDGSLRVEVGVQDLRESNGRCYTYDGCQGKHKTNHDTCEVTSKNSVDDDEHLLVGELSEAHVDTGGEEPDHHAQVEEESGPCGRLVLGDGGDDGNVDLCVSSVPEGVEATGPGCNDASDCQEDETTERNDENDQDKSTEQGLELLAGKLSANPIHECDQLEETEDTERRHVLRTANGQETNEGNLHTRKRAECIPRSVADVEPGAVASHADQHEGVQRQQVGDEDISTPCGDHVAVEQRGQRAPEHGTLLDSLDPQVEGEDEEEDGDSLVVVATSNRTRDVTGGDTHEGCGEQASGGGGDHLGGQEVGRERGKTRESWGEEHADVTNVDGEGEGAEKVVDGTAGNHQTGVEGTTSNATKGMPCSCLLCQSKVSSVGTHKVRAMRRRGIRSSNQSQKL